VIVRILPRLRRLKARLELFVVVPTWLWAQVPKRFQYLDLPQYQRVNARTHYVGVTLWLGNPL
jgi:hypothetical protein